MKHRRVCVVNRDVSLEFTHHLPPPFSQTSRPPERGAAFGFEIQGVPAGGTRADDSASATAPPPPPPPPRRRSPAPAVEVRRACTDAPSSSLLRPTAPSGDCGTAALSLQHDTPDAAQNRQDSGATDGGSTHRLRLRWDRPETGMVGSIVSRCPRWTPRRT